MQQVSDVRLLPNLSLFVQCQQWKHQNNLRILFKVNNKDARMTSCSGVFIDNFEQMLHMV